MASHTTPLEEVPSKRLLTSITLPAVAGPLGKVHNVPSASLLQLAWALVLRCYFATSSPCWGIIDLIQKDCGINRATPLQWVTLELDDQRSVEWILQNWNNQSVHHQLSSEESANILSPGQRIVIAIVPDLDDAEGLKETEVMAELMISFSALTEQPLIRLAWCPKRTASDEASHFTGSLQQALNAVFLTPDRPLRQLSLFGILDRQKLIAWNYQCPKPTERLVQDMFQDMVAARPQAVAVTAWDGELTYHQLDRLSSRLAIKLQSMHVQPESIVALCFEKSIWAIVAMLGVIRAGGAFLHLDPKHPPSRQQAMVTMTATQIVLCSGQTRDTASNCVTESQCLVIDSKMFAQEPDHSQIGSPSSADQIPTNAAYIVCTSGSTGLPKAMVVEHVSLCTSVTAQAAAMDVNSESRILQYAAYTFDVSIGDIFTALTHGACICVPSDWERSHDLVGAINRMDVNQACLTSTVASFLDPTDVPKLQKLTLGGEAASRQCIDLWSDKVVLKNVYGPAECTIWCAIQPKASSAIPASNIGRSIGSRAWIVHPEFADQIMPVGAIGELLIEGPLVARGYLNDAQKTGASFLEQPPKWMSTFKVMPSQGRFYRTGDLARFEHDGSILFLGRKDTQVKLRGQRLELGEVEYRIQQALPDPVPPLAVELIQTKDSLAPQLGAFITWTGGFDLKRDQTVGCHAASIDLDVRHQFNEAVSQVQAALERALPSYMMPSIFVPMQQLPLSTAGKLDRKMLRYYCAQHSRAFLSASENEHANSELDDAVTNPVELSETVPQSERMLAQLWAHVLGRKTDSIGSKDNFMSLGGDSLAAMRLVNMAARDAQVTLTVSNIFQSPVLADQATLLRPLSKTKHLAPFELIAREGNAINDMIKFAAQQCGRTPAEIEDVYPCTPLQEEMMRDSLTSDRTQMGQEVVQFSEELDLRRFQEACAYVYKKFPILRTRFVEWSGKLVQVVIREALCWHRPTSLTEYMALDSSKRPALGTPLTRWAITADQTHFIWSLHHAVFDGITLGHIQGAIYAVYQSIPIPPRPLSFATFLAHLDNQKAPLSQESSDFWRSYLYGGADSSIHPPVVEVQQIHTPHASQGMQRLVNFESGAVSSLQRYGLTEATLVRTAWACTLAQGQEAPSSEVVFGTMLTGRNFHLPGVDVLAAPSLTHVPIRIRMVDEPYGPSSREFLARVQADATAMIPFEHDGMDRIRCLDHRTRAVFERVQTLLVIQPIPEGLTSASASPFPGPIISGPRVEAKQMGHFHWYALLVECTLLPTKGFFVRVSFDNKIYSDEQVETLLDNFSDALHALSHGLMVDV